MVKNIKYYSGLFYLILCFLFLSQSNVYSISLVDSLEIELKNAKSKDKNEIYLRLSYELAPTNFDKSLEYGEKALSAFQKDKKQLKVAQVYQALAETYSYNNDFDNCLKYYQSALEIYKSENDKEGLANTYNGIGLNVYYYQNKIDEAIQNFNIALDQAGKEELIRSKVMNNLGTCYRRKGDLENALSFFQKSLPLAEKSGDLKEIAKINNNLGLTYFDLGSFEEAIEYYEVYSALRDKMGDKKGYGIGKNNIGNAYWQLGKYEKAIFNYQSALRIFEEIKFPQGVSSCLNNIGVIYQQINNFTKSLEFHRKALEVRLNIGDKKEISKTYSNIGVVQTSVLNEEFSKKYGANWEKDIFKILTMRQVLDIYKESIENFNKSLNLSEEINDLPGVAKALNNLGLVYNYSGFYNKALTFTERAYKINLQLRDESEQVTNLILLGSNYYKLGNFSLSDQYLVKAEEIAKKLELKDKLKTVYQYQADLYERKGEHDKALAAYKKFTEIKDTLLNKENYKQMTELQTQYESEKQKQQIELLNKDQALKESQINQQRWAIFIFIFIFILVAVVVVVIIKQYNAKKKANLVLAQKNDELAQKNELITHQKKEITDSIMYARRIQSAILPPEEFLAKELPEHFILYKPRDIVSGDFYWINEKNNKIYVITADCTGHGVPGAFMSMLGTSLLNQIITLNDNAKASEILNMLRDQIIKSLHQTGKTGENKDGMDLVFYILDKENRKIQYAGANNPLIIIRNSEIIEFKADKMPIGIHDLRNNSFTNHEFHLLPGDCLYSFTDGYPDQFGGPNGKKFMIKQLKQILCDIAPRSMDLQKEILDQSIIKWMEGVEQVDDILVIGVKI